MKNYKIGFVRSPSKAYREEQEILLKEYGCDKIIIHEYGEDAEKSEKALEELASIIRYQNDEIVVVSAERLIYESSVFKKFLEKAKEYNVKITILNDLGQGTYNTSLPIPFAMLIMIAGSIEYERKIIRQNLIKDGIIENGKIDKNKPKTTKKTKTIVS